MGKKDVKQALSGTNTKVEVIGASVNKKDLLLLVKFRAGGFYHFFGFNQSELADFSLRLNEVDKTLALEIENELLQSEHIDGLVEALNRVFVSRLKNDNRDFVTDAITKIITLNGNIAIRELPSEYSYCEKHLRRLFKQRVGTTPKMLSRIVRANYVLHLLQNNPQNIENISEKAGYFDQSHLYHDFKGVLNLTPNDYLKNMSLFYIAESI